MKRLLIATLLATALSVPAFANQCPADIAAIDAALASNTTLTDDQKAEVKAFRDEGEILHNEGKHTESVETLAKAKAILGIQ